MATENKTYEFCRREVDGRVLTLTMARPARLNALHPPASFEMAEILDAFAADPELWVAVITGEGERAFSAGNDLKYQAEQAMKGGARPEMPPAGFGGITNRSGLDKPVIAAVNGIAMGGGFEIALACDLIIASDNALFALPEPRVGLAALAGGLHRLARQIPLKHAMGMFLTGRHVPAEEAARLGLVNAVVPQAALMEEVRRHVEMILACSPVSIRTTKNVIRKGLEHASLEEALGATYPSVINLVKSEDFREGPLAFAQKRKPDWKGR